MRLSGKSALVTGAAGGIGRACAERFLAEGARVTLMDADASVRAVAVALGEGAAAVVADVSSDDAVRGAVETAVAHAGGLDALVANAGVVGEVASLLDLGPDAFRRVIEVNLIGTFLCIKHAATWMKDHEGGSIVCTGSVAGLRAGAGPAPYSASKAAVLNLVRLAATQLAGTGVRVNALAPGLIETEMTRPIFELARALGKEDRLGQLNPTRRAGTPADVAAAPSFSPRTTAPTSTARCWWWTAGWRRATRSCRGGCSRTQPSADS